MKKGLFDPPLWTTAKNIIADIFSARFTIFPCHQQECDHRGMRGNPNITYTRNSKLLEIYLYFISVMR